VEHFLVDPSPLAQLLGSARRVLLDPALRFEGRLEYRLDNLGMLTAEGLAYNNAMEGRHPRFAAVEDLPASTAEFHQLRPGTEISVGIDTSGGDIRSPHRRALIDDLDLVAEASLAQRLERHAPRSTAHRH